MEIKTCEQYVLDQLEQAQAERDWLRGKLEQAQDEAEELRGKLMERGERDASKVEQAIRKEGLRKALPRRHQLPNQRQQRRQPYPV